MTLPPAPPQPRVKTIQELVDEFLAGSRYSSRRRKRRRSAS